MATRLFLHDALNALSGTFPTSEQSTVGAPTIIAPTANTLRTMDSITGTSMITRSITASATTAQQIAFHGFFCSLALDSNQLIPPQTTTLNIANRENSSNMNFGPDLRAVAYVWRPSSGAMVGYITDGLVGAGDIEPAALSIRCNATSVTSTATISCAAGDVIICEIWNVFTQSSANAFQAAIYYDGTTINTTIGTASTSHASFYELGTSSLTFAQPPLVGDRSITLAAATVAATGRVAIVGAGSISCAAATLAATGRVAISGAFSATLANATLAATGTVQDPSSTGTRSVTLGAATVAATGAVAVSGAANITLAATTVAGAGRVAVAGGKAQTLEDATVAATGTVADAGTIAGTRAVTLANATLAATGSLGAQPSTPAPALPVGDSGGGVGARTRNRRKFVIPDLDMEPVKTLNDMLGIREEPEPKPVRESPTVPVSSFTLAQAVAASPPARQQTSTLPKPSPVVVEGEEYSDEDLMQLLLMVIP